MAVQVLEGTWEEISRHAAELAGKSLHLTVLPEPRNASAPHENTLAGNEEVREALRKIMARQAGLRDTDQYRLAAPGNSAASGQP
jgi:hypothetical protein